MNFSKDKAMTKLAKTRKLYKLQRARKLLRSAQQKIGWHYCDGRAYDQGDSDAVWLLLDKVNAITYEIDDLDF